jgi:alkylated DNA repair dioxygenase AlkB
MAALLALLKQRAGAPKAASPAPAPAAVASAAAGPTVGTAASSLAPPPADGAVLALSPAPLSPAPPAPQRCEYHAEAVSAAHAEALLAAVDDASHAALWVELRGRRLQRWAAPLPPFLARLAEGLVAAGVFEHDRPPNDVLVNSYAPGEGIAPHADGPAYDPRVATLSLGAPALMRYSVLYGRERGGERGGQAVGALVLRDRSLVVTSGELYTRYAHAIPEGGEGALDLAEEALACGGRLWTGEAEGALERDERRVSITIRHRFALR